MFGIGFNLSVIITFFTAKICIFNRYIDTQTYEHTNSIRRQTNRTTNKNRDFHIHMEIPEFTCLCPKTGQPDFAVIYLDYIPDQLCVELKSLKLYMWSFRDEGCFHEAVTNSILDDLVAATQPKFMRVTAKFFVRGGVFTNVIAEHRKDGWQPQPRVDLTQFETNSNIRG